VGYEPRSVLGSSSSSDIPLEQEHPREYRWKSCSWYGEALAGSASDDGNECVLSHMVQRYVCGGGDYASRQQPRGMA
jgi:hypothetical protein